MQRQAHIFKQRPDPINCEIVSDWVAPGWEDISELLWMEQSNWRGKLAAMEAARDAIAAAGGIALREGRTPAADVAAVTGVTANTALFQSGDYTPIAPLVSGQSAPVNFDLEMSGIVTSSAASQTIIWNPHIGPADANTVGTNLTASAAQTLGSTITNAIWSMDAQVTVRTAGGGTNGTAIGRFTFMFTVLANAGAPTSYMWRSTANATFSTVVLNGLIMGVTPSAAGVSIAAQQIRWVSY